MTRTLNLDKTRQELENAIANSMPLQAVVGAGDLAVAKLRDAQSQWASRAGGFDPKAIRDGAQHRLAAGFEALQSELSEPDKLKDLPTKAQEVVAETIAAAFTAYVDLAARGKHVVDRVRDQQATTEFTNQASATGSKAKATTTTAKKAATRTRTSAKSTATSAKRSSAAGAKAAKSGAGEVGK
jgi:heparin binding hemagglutinin HbhA